MFRGGKDLASVSRRSSLLEEAAMKRDHDKQQAEQARTGGISHRLGLQYMSQTDYETICQAIRQLENHSQAR